MLQSLPGPHIRQSVSVPTPSAVSGTPMPNDIIAESRNSVVSGATFLIHTTESRQKNIVATEQTAVNHAPRTETSPNPAAYLHSLIGLSLNDSPYRFEQKSLTLGMVALDESGKHGVRKQCSQKKAVKVTAFFSHHQARMSQWALISPIKRGSCSTFDIDAIPDQPDDK